MAILEGCVGVCLSGRDGWLGSQDGRSMLKCCRGTDSVDGTLQTWKPVRPWWWERASMTLGEAPGFVRDERNRDLSSEFVALLMNPAESAAESIITATGQGCQRPAPAHPAAGVRCPSVNPISVLARRDWGRRVHLFCLETKSGCFSRSMQAGCIGSCSHGAAPLLH